MNESDEEEVGMCTGCKDDIPEASLGMCSMEGNCHVCSDCVCPECACCFHLHCGCDVTDTDEQ